MPNRSPSQSSRLSRLSRRYGTSRASSLEQAGRQMERQRNAPSTVQAEVNAWNSGRIHSSQLSSAAKRALGF